MLVEVSAGISLMIHLTLMAPKRFKILEVVGDSNGWIKIQEDIVSKLLSGKIFWTIMV